MTSRKQGEDGSWLCNTTTSDSSVTEGGGVQKVQIWVTSFMNDSQVLMKKIVTLKVRRSASYTISKIKISLNP